MAAPHHVIGMGVQRLGDVGTPFRKCQWPMWDDRERPTGVFCSRPTERGSYCPYHASVAFRRPGDPVPKPPAEWSPKQVVAAAREEVNMPVKRKLIGAAAMFPPELRVHIKMEACKTEGQRAMASLYNAGQTYRQIRDATGLGLNSIASTIFRLRNRSEGRAGDAKRHAVELGSMTVSR
jgi:hypothetical protein